MFRLLAILGVVAAFGATLYYGGNRLEAWESPQAAVKAAEASGPKAEKKAKAKAKAKAKRRAQATRKGKPRRATWLVELNALCRRGKDATDAIREPSGPSDIPRFFRQYTDLNSRLNDQASALIRRSGNAKAARQLRRLFDQDEALIESMLTAAQKGQHQRLNNLVQSLLAVAKSENRLLGRIGAIDCTVSPDLFRL
jgi:hypothetical protein